MKKNKKTDLLEALTRRITANTNTLLIIREEIEALCLEIEKIRKSICEHKNCIGYSFEEDEKEYTKLCNDCGSYLIISQEEYYAHELEEKKALADKANADLKTAVEEAKSIVVG